VKSRPQKKPTCPRMHETPELEGSRAVVEG
jgi:hypothetical protein